MSAGQELLLRRSLTERFAPPVSIPAPSPSALPVVSQGGDPCSATLAANPPPHAFNVPSNCRRDWRKNPNWNTLFWLDLTICRMNTCTKRVGGWGVPISTLTLTPRGMQGLGERVGGAIAPPARLRYSAAQGSGDNF